MIELNKNGWVEPAVHAPSPNFNQRPEGVEIDMLVIHNISLPLGQFGTSDIIDLFQNKLNCDAHPSYDSLKGVKVSAHFLIRRKGELVQFVSVNDRAWHAGQSVFQGRENCNDFSIGVEMEGSDYEAFEPNQYDTLKDLIKVLQKHFSTITDDRIVGHCDIAPGRKTDPGPYFDWNRIS